MAIFATHVATAAPPNARSISAPMHARYIGGVCVDGETSTVQSFFALSTLEPDEPPSHTFVAHGKTEIPRRANTISSTLRRPSLSLKRSFSRLRNSSSPHGFAGHRRCQSEKCAEAPSSHVQSDSAGTSPSPSRESTVKRSWPSLGLSRNVVFDAAPRQKTVELDAIPEPPPKDDPRPTLIHAISTDEVKPAPVPSPPTAVKKKTPLAVRPKRVDSGAGDDFSNFSDFSDFVFDEEPICFQNMVEIQDYEERMGLYDSGRNYWATAEHGLAEWNGCAGAAAQTVAVQRTCNAV